MRPPITDPLAQLRLERDRHVAFAFAAADLLIEVGSDDVIIAASGAANALLGRDVSTLVGCPLAEVIAATDRPLLPYLLKQIRARFRIDPTVIAVTRADCPRVRTMLGGCRLPDRGPGLFLSLTLLPDAVLVPPQPRDESTGLLTQEAFGAAAQRLAGEQRQLQLIRLDGLSGAARQLPAEQATMLMQEIGAALRADSVGGDASGRLGDDAFGLITNACDEAQRSSLLTDSLAETIRGAGIPEGRIVTSVARLDLSFGNLTSSEAGHALSYALTSFAKSHGSNFDMANLQAGLTEAVERAIIRYSDTRQMLVGERFTLVYQPVVDLKNRAVCHYEALSRFPEGANTFETVVFSEHIGLIIEFDLIVCRRVIEAIRRNGNARVAVNLSGRSVQNDAFRHALLQLTAPLGDLRRHLLFELTESAEVDNLADAERFLAHLRSLGHAICLDDFGAGATAYNYLRRFDVDFLKIDGPFLLAAAQHGRERALIRSICTLGSELGCKVIGEMIENEPSAALAASLGVVHGQGWLFGPPIERLPAPPPSGAAQGLYRELAYRRQAR